MRFTGQLRFTDATHKKAQFYYQKREGNAVTRALPVEQLPPSIREKLEKSSAGIRLELPIENGQIDLRALADAPPMQPNRHPDRRQPGEQPRPEQAELRKFERLEKQWGFEGGKPTEIEIVIADPPFDRQMERDKVNITDPGLAFQRGNVLKGVKPPVVLHTFGPQILGLDGHVPDINRNPYNFVEFAGEAPWEETEAGLTHAHEMGQRDSGVIEFEIKALTPVFVPEGFPFGGAEADKEPLRKVARHFMRMENAEGQRRYAIPGSSIKGMLRTEVEALTNSRLGVMLNDEFFSKPIPYRRRSFKHAGVITGPHASGHGWAVQPVEVLYMTKSDWNGKEPAEGSSFHYREGSNPRNRDDQKRYAFSATNADGVALKNPNDFRPYRGQLLAAPCNKKYYGTITKPAGGKPLLLPYAVESTYKENLDHEHYKRHFKDHAKTYTAPAGFHQMLAKLKQIGPGDLIYYTAEADRITTFGKNINYLWPASKTISKMTEKFSRPAEYKLGTGNPLSAAERLFGFSGKHTPDGRSHPFRGLLRFETAWGPEAAEHADERQWAELKRGCAAPATNPKGWQIELAPLTGPATRAKSRPLYLAPKPGSGPEPRSASFEDNDAKLRGRKFYWPQSDPGSPGNIWPFHLRDANLHDKVKTQLPPKLFALSAGTEFTACIHFRNLQKWELGAVLYAIEGAGPDAGDHTLRIGKGKPRGLGNIRCRVTQLRIDAPAADWLDLTKTPQPRTGDKKACVETFQKWVSGHCGNRAFNSIEYIGSYRKLHEWKEGVQVRYYPINFGQYGWLPKPGDTKGEPAGERVPAMKRAGEL